MNLVQACSQVLRGRAYALMPAHPLTREPCGVAFPDSGSHSDPYCYSHPDMGAPRPCFARAVR
eukprot:3395401-Alexandrium_andersonii.AAC.1